MTKTFNIKKVDWLKPDAKSQVTFMYEDGKPKAIDTIVLSTQHSKEISLEIALSLIINCSDKIDIIP